MENYILELIRDNNRVIVPNFGAFIVAKEKGFTILFNNFLSFNDGLLVEHVMKEEEVDKLEATDRVNKYVELINKTLDTIGNYSLEGLGIFTKDSNGILRFTQAEELNQSDFLDKEEEKKEELLDLDNTLIEQAPVTEDTKTSIISPPDERVEDIAEPLEKGFEEEKKISYEADKMEKEEKKKQSLALFIILFVLIPIIGTAAYFLFFNQSDKGTKEEVAVQNVVKEKEALKNPILDQPDSKSANDGIEAGPESSIKAEDKPLKKETLTTPAKKQVAPSGRRHHLITGSFKEEKNADKYVQLMVKKGFSTAFKIEKNNMFMVSIESQPSLSKAMERQEEIVNQYKLESWILTVK